MKKYLKGNPQKVFTLVKFYCCWRCKIWGNPIRSKGLGQEEDLWRWLP